MGDQPRILRIDRIGATAEVPYTRTIQDMKSQRWIADRFYRLMGRGAYFWANPEEAMGAGIGRGANYFDLKDTASRIKCVDEAPKENIRSALRLEGLAKREDAAGHTETACDYFYRACHFYIAAAWGIFDHKNPELIWLMKKVESTFDKVIEYNRYPMERVEIPFEGKSIPGVLTLTPERKKAPTILVIPGMDLHKENVKNHQNNHYVARGMNTLMIDGPGQGESLMREIWVDEENYGRAGKAAIDYLVTRPEVDAEKIGAHGTSMGSYWAPLTAIHDSRLKAVSTLASCHYDKDHIFNETSPNFRQRFLWMAGNLDDAAFDRMAAKMTLEGREGDIKCSYLIFHGEFDHLTDTEEVYQYFDRLASDVKEFRIYENQYHGASRFSDEVSSMSGDWLRDRLNGVTPKQKRKIVLVDWNKKEHPVDEEKIRQGFSYLFAEEA